MKAKTGRGAIDWTVGNVKGFSSKQLINLDNGTVKMVQVHSHAEYPLHRHPDKTEYAYVIDGNLEFTIGDEMYSGEPGDFFIFGTLTMHAIHNKTSKEGILLIGAIKNY